MKAIIISDEEARGLLDQLKLTSMQESNVMRKERATPEDMHRAFHYVVCRWLQEMGANVVR